MKMLYIFFLIVTIVLSQTNSTENNTNTTISNSDPNCDTGILNGTICCHNSCDTCNVCGNNTNNDLCCGETIKRKNLYCSNNTPPCIYNDDIPFSLTLDQIIIISVVATVVIIALIYICCIFRKKKPPLDYSEIIGKFD